MMGGRGGNRQMRRMMDKMGLDMEELPNVQEVIIKTDKKEIIIAKPAVTEMKAKDNSIFQVVAESYEEKNWKFKFLVRRIYHWYVSRQTLMKKLQKMLLLKQKAIWLERFYC